MSSGIKQAPSAFDGSLTPYLREIQRFPMLALDEEYLLARRWREHGDATAAHRSSPAISVSS